MEKNVSNLNILKYKKVLVLRSADQGADRRTINFFKRSTNLNVYTIKTERQLKGLLRPMRVWK